MKGKVLAVIAVLFMLSAPTVMAQDFCINDLNYDGVVNPADTNILFENFPRNPLQNPCPPDGPAPVPKTGQTTSYATGDDGDLECGVLWPEPRIIDPSGFGLMIDKLTGLQWLFFDPADQTYSECSNYCSDAYLADYDYGDFRIPNVRELLSLVDFENTDPAWVEGTNWPRQTLTEERYWTSTMDLSAFSDAAWVIYSSSGRIDSLNMTVQSAGCVCVHGCR